MIIECFSLPEINQKVFQSINFHLSVMIFVIRAVVDLFDAECIFILTAIWQPHNIQMILFFMHLNFVSDDFDDEYEKKQTFSNGLRTIKFDLASFFNRISFRFEKYFLTNLRPILFDTLARECLNWFQSRHLSDSNELSKCKSLFNSATLFNILMNELCRPSLNSVADWHFYRLLNTNLKQILKFTNNLF